MKKILGITALFAVLAVLSFTTCNLPEVDDGEERTVIFKNNSEARITVTCSVGKPSSFTLEKAISQTDNGQEVTVTNTGKDIVLQTITVQDVPVDPWNAIEISENSTIVGGNGKRKDGLSVKSGVIIFQAVRGNDNGFRWDVDTLPKGE